MDYYRKFCSEMSALMIEMNRSSGDAKSGMIPVDARLFNEAVRIVGKARDSFNQLMEFKTNEAQRGFQKRYKLAEKETRSAKPAPKKKAETKAA